MKFASIAAGAVAALGLTATAAFAEKWDMPMAYSASNFHSKNGAEFAKCVTDGTKGKLEIVTHPSGSLFKGNDIKRAVQTGQALIGERLLSAHQNENPLFGIDAVPFLATSFDDSEKLWKAAQPKIKEILDKQNLVYLYAVPWPPQGLYANKPVESVKDLEGLKFRAYNSATARFAELAKMRPVQIEAAELSQALATGVAQSFISSGATGYDRKVWEHLSHFYAVDAWLPRNTVFVNKQAYNKLDDATKGVLNSCAEEAASRGLQASKDYTNFTLDGLKKGGMSVAPAGDKLKGDLQAIGATMSEEWSKSAGDEGQAVLESFKKM
ncbi:MAG: TRAP transporter substrate-binding protein [Pseudomonadota bacterium]